MISSLQVWLLPSTSSIQTRTSDSLSVTIPLENHPERRFPPQMKPFDHQHLAADHWNGKRPNIYMFFSKKDGWITVETNKVNERTVHDCPKRLDFKVIMSINGATISTSKCASPSFASNETNLETPPEIQSCTFSIALQTVIILNN